MKAFYDQISETPRAITSDLNNNTFVDDNDADNGDGGYDDDIF